ncbi:MAG: M3 family metallopeptidase, partial [Pseudomonadota bacterium]
MKKISSIASVFAFAACVSACDQNAPGAAQTPPQSETNAAVSAADMANNPFFIDWDTAYGVPPFERIADEHFLPAIELGIEQLRSEIDAIATNSEPATFENTIVALDLAGRQLNKVAYTFSNITATDTNDTLRALESQIYPLLTREQNNIQFNTALFERVKAVHAQKAELALEAQDARLLELTYRDFLRAGADLDADKKARVAEINEELSALTTTFGQNLLTATVDFKLELTKPEELAGLTDRFKSTIKVAGEDKWVVGLNRSPFETFMTQSTNRAVREKLFNGYRLRASSGEGDNGPLVIKMAQLRAERAALLGYKTHAEYQLETRMAKTPEAAEAFLVQVLAPGLARAREERADIQVLIAADGDSFAAAGHDWWHYSERVRAEKFAFDDAALTPYFELGAVRDGAFDVATKLFGVTFEAVDTPVWNPDVASFNVKAPDGTHLGLFMADMYARASKRGGAWMSSFRPAYAVGDDAVRPIVSNNLNLTKPQNGKPTLLRFDEVETLFHEFGHGLHGLLTQIKYQRFSGVDGPRDYTEFPAQILEHWAGQKAVLAEFAKHYETGAVIPDALI